MRTVVLSVLAVPVLLLTACGADEPSALDVSMGGTQLYEADATVLEQGGGDVTAHGPELCLGAISASLPPQCGGPPIANWDWDAVEGEETLSGTTWGSYHVVGTYADGVLTVTQVDAPDPEGEAERWLVEELGLEMTWSSEGLLGEGAAEVGVVVDPGGAGQAAFDERYGPGMVRLFPALRPVE